MSLVAYTITALEETFANSQSSGKNIVVGAVCSMYSQPSDTVVTLYDDAAGSNGSTAKTTGADGQVAVYINPGEYRLSINGSDSFITISEMKPITTIDLIAQNRQIETGAIIETTGYTNGGDGGGGSWIQNGVTGQTASQSPAQLVGGLLNDANGNQWEYTSRPVKVKAMGAVPISTSPTADSTAAIQAAIYIFKDPSLVNLEAVIASGDATREIYGNEIDFDGGQYLVSNNIDYSLCHGIHFKNGAVIADDNESFTSGEALIQNKVSFCINPKFSDFIIECNGVTNGLFMERCVYGIVDNLRVYGWGLQEYGTKASSTTLGFTTNIQFNDYKAWGTIAAETVNLLAATGTGLIITDSDCEVTGGEISRGLIGASLASAGSIRGMHFTGNGNNNVVGAYLTGVTNQKILDCYFDNTILELNGFRENTVIGNMFANSGGVESTQAIKINSVKSNDDAADCIILGNRAKLANGQRFITLDETAGEFQELGQTKVTDNICRESTALAALPTQETQGVIVVSVLDTDFNGLAVEVGLSDRILFADAPNASFSGTVTASPNTLGATPYCKGILYDSATQILTVMFSERYSGKFSVAYSWGAQDNALAASLPSTVVTSAHHSFSGYLNANATNTTGNGTVYPIVFDRERYDNGSVFDTGTGQAIIKTGGVYTIDSQVMIDGLSSATDLLFTVTAGARVFEDRRSGTFSGQDSLRISGGVLLDAGDTISCTITVSGNGADNVTVNGSGDYRTYISAMLMP